MSTRIHPQARTTPKIRQEIKDYRLSDREAAKVFNITRATAAKWPKRDDVQDRSHRGHTLHTTLSTTQDANRNYSLSAFMIKRDWTLTQQYIRRMMHEQARLLRNYQLASHKLK